MDEGIRDADDGSYYGQEVSYGSTSTVTAKDLLEMSEGGGLIHGQTFPLRGKNGLLADEGSSPHRKRNRNRNRNRNSRNRHRSQAGDGASDKYYSYGICAQSASQLSRPRERDSGRSDDDKAGSVTTVSLFAQICCAVLGPTLLACPYAVARGGIAISLGLAVFFAVMCDVSLLLLVRCADACERYDFEELVSLHLGFAAKRTLQAAMLLLLLLLMISDLIIFADIISPLGALISHNAIGREGWWATWSSVAATGSGVVMLVLSIGRLWTLAGLPKRTSEAILAVTVCALCTCLFFLKDHAAAFREPSVDFGPVGTIGGDDVSLGIPIWIMMYLSHHKVLPAYRGLPKAKRWAFPWIVHVAMLLSVLVSVSVGLFGALQLGSGVSGNFLKIAARTPTHTDDTATGKGGIDTILTLHMRIALAVVAFGALVAIPSVCSRFLLLLERMLAECLDGEEVKSLRKILQWVGTPVILALATLAAVLIGDLAKCADLMGSSAGVLVAFVYPGLVFTARWEIEAFPGYVIISSKARRLCREKKLGLIAKWTALVISVLGMAVGTIGLMGTLLAW